MSNWLTGLMGRATAPQEEISVSTLLNRVSSPSTTDELRNSLVSLRKMIDNPTNVRGSELRTVPLSTPQYDNINLFVQDSENSDTILNLLADDDKNTRYFATKLLTYLLANNCQAIENCILKNSINITRMIDLLKSGSEMIRNEALLLLIEITKTNVELQKVVAFEGGFEKCFQIIESEGNGNGGIVVQDCLTLICNLLASNQSNQNHFREMGNISKLVSLLELDQSDMYIVSDDKKEILCLSLQIISYLVSSSCTATVSSQKTQNQLLSLGVLHKIIILALCGVKAPTVRIKALWALGDAILNHEENRNFFEKQDFKAHNGGTISSILRITQLLFASKVPQEELGALHVLKCYLYLNPDSQRTLGATLSSSSSSSLSNTNPTTDDLYPSRLIVKNALNWEHCGSDISRPFYAVTSIGYLLLNNNHLKEKFLSIPFDHPIPGVPIQNLLHKFCSFVIKSIQVKSEVPITFSFLRTIALWIDDCPSALQQFLSTQANLRFMFDIIRAFPASNPSQSIYDPNIVSMCATITAIAILGAPSIFADLKIIDWILPPLEFLANQNSEFKRISDVRTHQLEDESKLPYYDHAFKSSFSKLYNAVIQLRPQKQHPHSDAPQSQTSVQSDPPFSSNGITQTHIYHNHNATQSTPTEIQSPVQNGKEKVHPTHSASPSSDHHSPHHHNHSNHHDHHDHHHSGHDDVQNHQNLLQNQKLIEQITKLQTQVADLQLKNAAISIENDELKQKIRGMEEKLQASSQESVSESSHANGTSSEYQSLEQKYKSLLSEYNEQKSSMEDLLVLLAETEEENTKLKAESASIL